jgi:hypothetical protein
MLWLSLMILPDLGLAEAKSGSGPSDAPDVHWAPALDVCGKRHCSSALSPVEALWAHISPDIFYVIDTISTRIDFVDDDPAVWDADRSGPKAVLPFIIHNG